MTTSEGTEGEVAQEASSDDWRQRIIDEQQLDLPKERTRTYYHSDGLGGSPQMWVKHTPGMNIPLRIQKVWPTGRLENEDHHASLQMNIGSEIQAYRLYKALEAYFNDIRTVPWFLASDSDA